MMGNTCNEEIKSCLFDQFMNRSQADCYVTDLETDEILYMNRHMCENYRIQDYQGKTCWKVLQVGMHERCDFCPVRKLLASHTSSMEWEDHHPISGHVYRNVDKIETLKTGQKIHIHFSQDVTEAAKLTKVANIDELTGMLTRRAGKEALANSLYKVQNNNTSIVVCMYDLNNLKKINDTYGHAEGDAFLCLVSDAVKKSLEKTDYAMRFGGDEFIVVYENIGELQAIDRIEAVLKHLNQLQKDLHKLYDIGFCYGVYEITEKESVQMQKVLDVIDERMYKQKRRYHIQVSQDNMKNPSMQTATKKNFTYQAEQLYDALIESTDDYIYVCDMNTGTFRYPPAMVEEFDLPGEVIENAAAVWGERIHEEDKQKFLEANQEIADDRCSEHCVEYRARNKKGQWIRLRCRGYLMHDAYGNPSIFAGIITNLTKKTVEQ